MIIDMMDSNHWTDSEDAIECHLLLTYLRGTSMAISLLRMAQGRIQNQHQFKLSIEHSTTTTMGISSPVVIAQLSNERGEFWIPDW